MIFLAALLFIAATAVSYGRWRADRTSEPEKWSVVMFGLFAAILCEITATDSFEVDLGVWGPKVLLAALALFPYSVLRFARSFEGPPTVRDRLALAFALGMAAAALALPGLGTEGSISRGVLFYLYALVVEWTVLSVGAARRLWQASAGLPAVARKRLQLMAVAFLALEAALLATVVAAHGTFEVVSQFLVFVTSFLFFLSVAPPPVLRQLWRQADRSTFEDTITGLLQASTSTEIGEVLLGDALRLVGADEATLTNESGRIVARAGRNGTRTPAKNIESLDLGNGFHLKVAFGPHSPYFGSDEVALLKTVGALAKVALERNALLEEQVGISETLQVEVDERNRAERAARENSVFFHSIIENIPEMVFVKEADELRFVLWSKGGRDLVGYTQEELLGKNDFDLFPREQAEFFTSTDRKVLESGELYDIPEEPITASDGEEHILHTKKIPLYDEDGKARYLLAISTDITEYKRTQAEMQAARDEAEKANRAKSDFLSRMSHELRTPLNSILGYTQLLDMDDLRPDQSESVKEIQRAGRHLLDLINEVLDLSRIEAGRLSMSMEPVFVAELVEETVSLVRPLAQQRGITLNLDEDGVADRYVLADKQRLKQVMLNLLSNAIKYNRQDGTVRIALAINDEVAISVADTGYGIPAAKLDRLFTAFDRLDVRDESVEGTGLGLSVSHSLVDLMGGRLEVSSEIGVGSRFTVHLPCADRPDVPEADTSGREAPIVLEDRTASVLCIEDNAANIRLLDRIFRLRPKVTLMSAQTGEEGIALAKRLHPDLVLLDVNLPDMNGPAVLDRLQTDPDTSDIPVAFVSADATESQIRRLLEAGAAAYITKPLDVNHFLTTIDGLLAEMQTVAK